MLNMILPTFLLLPVLSIVVFSATATSPPIVELSYGSFRGNTTGNITSFLGVPFAQAP